MWLIFFIISVASLVLPALFSLGINNFKTSKKKKLKFFNVLFACVFVSAFFMFFPAQLTRSDVSAIGVLRSMLLAVLSSIQVFAAGCDFSEITESIAQCPSWLAEIYQAWGAIIYVVAPMFTIGVVLSLFKNLSAYLKYLLMRFKDVYVFSELNEKSMVLASDIKSKNKNSVIVFTDVFEENEESVYELVEEAKKLGAICFKKDILIVDFKKHSNKKSIFFFAIGMDETENLNQALKLVENYRDRENTHLYVFSTKIEGELLLTAIDKGAIKVRRINEVQSLVNRLLYEHGDVLFDTARELPDGNKKISAIVVGLGNHGTEMLKALTWFGQMNGYKLEINAFDRSPLAEERFTALAPELMSPNYNGVDLEGEAQYKITIHSDIDVSSITFAKEISKIDDATYVIVALGNDDVNINTAVTLRMYFERLKIHPVIHAIVYNSPQKKALEGIKNYRGQAYDIDFVGDIETSYAESVIIGSELEGEALRRHLKWGNEEEFWTYEYNYRSSIASAIHVGARIHCKIPGAEKNEKDLTDEERLIIEILEHRRWNAYMRSEGYVFSGSPDKSSRNDLAKMHHNLVDYSLLTEEVKRLDSRVGTK